MAKKLPLKTMTLTATIVSAYMTNVNISGFTQQDELVSIDFEMEGTHSPDVIRATAASFLEEVFDERYSYTSGGVDETSLEVGHFK